jgi:hypothetical protein
VGPTDGLDDVEKRQIPALDGNQTPTVQPVAIPTELSRQTIISARLTVTPEYVAAVSKVIDEIC